MKRLLTSLPIFAGMVLLMTGADFRTPPQKAVVELKKHCAGYTVLEAGLGVDCNGDTVKLIKKYGYYELASHFEKSELTVSAN